ncbi:MAG: S8 family serine peptidase [Clostridia bacterium]|nr:S8 family serine peptidase [Clostridia bacterium]
MKIAAFLMSLLLSVSGLFHTAWSTAVDAVSEMLYGIPCTSEAINARVLDEIEDADVVALGDGTGYVPDLLLVFLEEGVTFRERLTALRGAGLSVAGWCAPANLFVVRCLPAGLETLRNRCAAIEKNSGVALAAPVMTGRIAPQRIPNDPFDFYGDPAKEWDELSPDGANWWLEAVHARQAWDYSAQFHPVNTGVVDDGFQLDHPDLEGKISFPTQRLFKRYSVESHGSHVAGIIAAEQDNGVGMTGHCPQAKLICADWAPTEKQHWNTDLSVLFGMTAVVKAGAKAINFSLGVTSSMEGDEIGFFYRELEPRVISYAMASLLRKGYDFLIVQSAGNGNAYGFPVDAINNGEFAGITERTTFVGLTGVKKQEILDRILIVAAAAQKWDGTIQLASYSNYGSRAEIAAPGSHIYSTIPENDYAYYSGTSMAAPVVTAAASLVWSVDPDLTGAQVKRILLENADAGRVLPNAETPEWTQAYPLVNAKRSVEAALRGAAAETITVTGTAPEGTAELRFAGVTHTVYSDGSFDFVATATEGTAEALDANGQALATADVQARAGETVTLTLTAPTEEPPTDEALQQAA